MKIINFKPLKIIDGVEFAEITLTKGWFKRKSTAIIFKEKLGNFWRWLDSGLFAGEFEGDRYSIEMQKSAYEARNLFNKT
jgi:hypothetical protein